MKKPDRRPSAARRGYGPAWQKARKGFLAKYPWCVICQRMGKLILATDVDHIIPHRGDMKLFWDRTNWQPLCDRCSNSKSASEQHSYRTGKPVVVSMKGCDSKGWPIDPTHVWNK